MDDCLDSAPVYNWQEITKDFKQAAEGLSLGELIHDENFSLFEAMSAIELMDPKMDAGMHRSTVTGFRQALEEDLIKLNGFTNPELISIMDALFACFVTWIEGHSAAQTLFICLYLHEPYEVKDVILKGFCLGLLKLVHVCRDVITKAGTWEEEDFQSSFYGFDLAGDITEQRAIGMLREVEEELMRRVKEQPDTVGALLARIKFLRMLMIAIISLSTKEVKGILVHSGAAKVGHASQLEDAQKVIAQCGPVLQRILETVNLGAVHNEDTDNYASFPGFIPGVTKRLLPPTFPRQSKILSRADGLAYFQNLLTRIDTICGVPLQLVSYDHILEFFRSFGSTQTCALSRAVLQLAYFPSGDRSHLTDHILESMRQFTQPPALMTKSILSSDHVGKTLFSEFTGDCTSVFLSIIQITGHNRARQREKMAAVMEEISQLQEVADKVDGHFHQSIVDGMDSLSINRAPHQHHHVACFASYILYHVLLLMQQYLFVHFELELFSVYEFVYIYWYLYAVVYKWKISVLSRVDNFMVEQEFNLSKQDKTKGDRKKMKRKKPRLHRAEILEHHAFQKLCEACYRAMVGLQMGSKIELPEFAKHDSRASAMRYEHRLLPLSQLITPPFYNYQNFLDLSGFSQALQTCRPEDVYAEASQSFDEAKSAFENLNRNNAETMDLIKICRNNSIVLRLLSSGHKKDSRVQPDMDFSLHRCFPLIRLK